MSEHEALALIGTSAGDPTCIFEAPASVYENEIQLYMYALDFSFRHHGNPCPEVDLHPEAWGICFTPYATIHGATWSHRLSKMSSHERELYLSSFINAPGSKILGKGPTAYSI